jgi:hypothetical protein
MNGPSQAAYYYKSCTINKRHYIKYSVDENAPVITNLSSATPSYIDYIVGKNNPSSQWTKLQSYGVLLEIMKVQLSSQQKEVLFKVNWYKTIVETHNYVIKVEDDCRFIKINTNLN